MDGIESMIRKSLGKPVRKGAGRDLSEEVLAPLKEEARGLLESLDSGAEWNEEKGRYEGGAETVLSRVNQTIAYYTEMAEKCEKLHTELEPLVNDWHSRGISDVDAGILTLGSGFGRALEVCDITAEWMVLQDIARFARQKVRGITEVFLD